MQVLSRDPFTHRKVSDSSVQGEGTVEVHPLVLLGAVNSHAVLLPVLIIRLALHPVGVGEGLPAGPHPAALPVQVISTQPPGREAQGATISNLYVLLYLLLLLGVLRFRQVPLVVVATLHGIKPGHSVTKPRVGGTNIIVMRLDQHVTLPRPIRPITPPIVWVTAQKRIGIIVILLCY